MFKEIFNRKTDTVDSLVKSYRQIESKKAELIGKRDGMRLKALTAGTDATMKKIRAINEEIAVCDSGLSEVKKRMVDLLTDKAKADYESAPQRQADLQVAFDELANRAGSLVGEGVMLLNALGSPFHTRLAESIMEGYGVLTRQGAYAKTSQVFSDGFVSGMNPTEAPRDFFSEMKSLKRIAQRIPGDPGTQRGIKAKAEQLLKGAE